MKDSGFKEFLEALTQDFSDEELLLSTLQSLVASEIMIRRTKMGMNQNEFAKHMGVSQGLISRWEKGETNFTLETLVKIACKLGIEMQCPFVLASPNSYSSVSSNVVRFPGPSWTAVHSTPAADSYEELEEM